MEQQSEYSYYTEQDDEEGYEDEENSHIKSNKKSNLSKKSLNESDDN